MGLFGNPGTDWLPPSPVERMRIRNEDVKELVRLRGLKDLSRFRKAAHSLNHRLLAGEKIAEDVPLSMLRWAMRPPRRPRRKG